MNLIASLCIFAAMTFPEKDPLDPEFEWHDCSEPAALEGRGYPGVAEPFSRLPEKFRGKVSDKVWELSQSTIGFSARFITDSDIVYARWEFPKFIEYPKYFPSIAVSGIDIYSRRPGQEKWHHVNYQASGSRFLPGSNRKGPSTHAGEVKLKWRPGDEMLIYFPSHLAPKNFAIGLKKGASFTKGRPHIVDKPVAIYGTSFVEGYICSRAGLVLSSLIGRVGDFETVNLGFSESAFMEPSMAEVVAGVDAALYVIDCEPEMTDAMIDANYEKFLRRLQELRPDVPVLLVGGCTSETKPTAKETKALAILEKLKKSEPAKFAKYHHLSGVELLPKYEGALMDAFHPNDHGFMYMAPVYAAKIRNILGK